MTIFRPGGASSAPPVVGGGLSLATFPPAIASLMLTVTGQGPVTGDMFLSRVMPVVGITLSTLSVSIQQAGGGTGYLRGGIYDAAGNLLAQSLAYAAPFSPGLFALPLISPLTVSGAVALYFGLVSSVNALSVLARGANFQGSGPACNAFVPNVNATSSMPLSVSLGNQTEYATHIVGY